MCDLSYANSEMRCHYNLCDGLQEHFPLGLFQSVGQARVEEQRGGEMPSLQGLENSRHYPVNKIERVHAERSVNQQKSGERVQLLL